MMKKGFTLIELSIVLVIIGLLTGGVLVGQSLIKAAKIKSFVQQIQQYDTSVSLFQSRYNSLPGDSPLFPLEGCEAGVTPAYGYRGDGKLTNSDAVGTYICMEMANFWSQLSLAGLKESYQAIPAAPTLFKVGTHVPRSELGTNATGIIAVTAEVDTQVNGCNETYVYGQNYYLIYDMARVNGQAGPPIVDFQDGIEGQDGMAVDAKMDDGSGLTGEVLAFDTTDEVPSASTPLLCNHVLTHTNAGWTNGKRVNYLGNNPDGDPIGKVLMAIKMGSVTGIQQ
jgi:prepilin-type N-terminal cleavage/methylation domain-containing protein